MTQTTTTPSTNESTEAVLIPAVERAATNLLSISRLWVSHGLELGRSALATSAESLRILSETLADAKSHVQGETEKTPSDVQ